MSVKQKSKSGAAVAVPAKRFGKPLGQRLAENWQLYALLLIPVVLTFVYKYIPMYGIQIAFRDFNPNLGYLGSKWVGLDWFVKSEAKRS